jgi:hypothetical protein
LHAHLSALLRFGPFESASLAVCGSHVKVARGKCGSESYLPDLPIQSRMSNRGRRRTPDPEIECTAHIFLLASGAHLHRPSKTSKLEYLCLIDASMFLFLSTKYGNGLDS